MKEPFVPLIFSLLSPIGHDPDNNEEVAAASWEIGEIWKK